MGSRASTRNGRASCGLQRAFAGGRLTYEYDGPLVDGAHGLYARHVLFRGRSGRPVLGQLFFDDRARRTPGPDPFSGMNWMPAVSRAAVSACRVASRGTVCEFSILARVRIVTPDALAKSSRVQSISARAARICSGRMSSFMPFLLENVTKSDIVTSVYALWPHKVLTTPGAA